MKKFIVAAEDTKGDQLDDLLDSIEEDFDFAVAGIDKLRRDGNNGIALEQAQALSDALQNVINAITSEV